MVIIRNGKKYYTLEETIKRTDEFIKKSANEMIIELKKIRAEKFKSGKEVIFSNEGELCIK